METLVHTADGSLKTKGITPGTRVKKQVQSSNKFASFGSNPKGIRIMEGIYRGENCKNGLHVEKDYVCVEVELRASGMTCSHTHKERLVAVNG